MKIAKNRIIDALRERDQDIRADWVARELPDVVDTATHGGLLATLNLDPEALADGPDAEP